MNWKKKRNHSKTNSVIQEIKIYKLVRIYIYIIGAVFLFGWIFGLVFFKLFVIFILYTILLHIYFKMQDKIHKLAHNNIYSNKTIIAFNLEEVLHVGDIIFAVNDEWKYYTKEVENKSIIFEDYTESPPGKFEYFCWEKTFKYKLMGFKKTYKKEIIILPKHKYFELISELKMKYPAFEYKSDETHVIAIELDKRFLTTSRETPF
ncbi:hypothetical protein QQ060_003043 [Listeria monocytogenes]|nr:hypothetical protein [Listeria monocytogenes]